MRNDLLQPLVNLIGLRPKNMQKGFLYQVNSTIGTKLDVTDRSDIAHQLELINLTEEDLKVVLCVKPIIEQHIDEIVDVFYQSILDVDKLRTIITTNSTVDRLRTTLRAHLIELFNGVIDDEFIKARLRIAHVHLRIGLDPKWYMAAFQKLFNSFLDIIYLKIQDIDERYIAINVVSKLLNFEQQLVLDAYEEENLNQREQQYEAIKEMLKSKIASLSEELAGLTEETNASVEELLASSMEINTTIMFNTSNSKKTHELAQQGTGKMNELNVQISSIFDSTGRMEQTVNQLNQSSKQISKIISFVDNMAKQINMLSLNASIEAKRAGEHGRGFSVVAVEVQKLAIETKKTVVRISELITLSNNYASLVTEAIIDVQQAINNGKDKARDTTEVFNTIKSSMDINIEESIRVEHEMNTLVQVIERIGDSANQVALSAETLNQTTVDL